MSTKHANEMLKACAPKAVRFRVQVKRAYLVYTTHSVCESILFRQKKKYTTQQRDASLRFRISFTSLEQKKSQTVVRNLLLNSFHDDCPNSSSASFQVRVSSCD